jgi:hypothetical protein
MVRAYELLGYSKEGFCAEFAGLSVEVKTEKSWASLDGPVCGTYDVFKGITTNHKMGSLVHELFHAIDVHRLGVTTGSHTNWDKNGRYALDSDFMAESQQIVAR